MNDNDIRNGRIERTCVKQNSVPFLPVVNCRSLCMEKGKELVGANWLLFGTTETFIYLFSLRMMYHFIWFGWQIHCRPLRWVELDAQFSATKVLLISLSLSHLQIFLRNSLYLSYFPTFFHYYVGGSPRIWR